MDFFSFILEKESYTEWNKNERGGNEVVAAGAMVPIMVAAQHSSSYRVKFRRKEFLALVEMAEPKIIYHVRRMYFFSYDGFVMYTFECDDTDFKQKVLHAIEFSNTAWSEPL